MPGSRKAGADGPRNGDQCGSQSRVCAGVETVCGNKLSLGSQVSG